MIDLVWGEILTRNDRFILDEREEEQLVPRYLVSMLLLGYCPGNLGGELFVPTLFSYRLSSQRQSMLTRSG